MNLSMINRKELSQKSELSNFNQLTSLIRDVSATVNHTNTLNKILNTAILNVKNDVESFNKRLDTKADKNYTSSEVKKMVFIHILIAKFNFKIK